MNTQLTKIILLLASILLLISCDNKKQFIVQGNVNGADTLMLYLERRGHSDVAILDSMKLNKEGRFSFKHDALSYSEFYRLRLENQSINFSVDSTETIEVMADKSTFATQYTISGSSSSELIKESVLSQIALGESINSLRKQYEGKKLTDVQFVDSISSVIERYKEKGRDMILDDYKSPAAYFTLFQKIEGMLLFDPGDKKDLNLFRAVATVWDTYHPNSPRTAQLKDYTLKAVANLKAIENRQATIDKLNSSEVTEHTDFFEVTLPNINGKDVSTKSMKGKIVLLDFTIYQNEHSVAHNVRLNQVYEKHKSTIEIYQVSFDTDKHAWQNSAINLPWVCVRDEQSLNSTLFSKFNLEGLPTTFILNRNGEIIKKLVLSDDIGAEVAKVL